MVFKALTGLCQYLCEKYSISLEELRYKLLRKIDTYTVKAGDTLWSIAESFNVSVDTLIRLNGLKGEF